MKKLFIALVSLVLILSMGGCTFDPNKALEDEEIFQEPEPEYEFRIEVLDYEIAESFELPNGETASAPEEEDTLMRIRLKVTNLAGGTRYFYSNVFNTPFYLYNGNDRFLVNTQAGLTGEQLLDGESTTGYVYVVIPERLDWTKTKRLEYTYAFPAYDTIIVEF